MALWKDGTLRSVPDSIRAIGSRKSWAMLGIGPHIILDKSVLEMLSGDEFSLLTEYFRLVVPPVLIEEIVADLVLLCYKKGDPQKGQPESCRSRTRAMVCRSVAMDQGLCRSTRTGRTPRAELERHFGDG
jgi:hypothetical protein